MTVESIQHLLSQGLFPGVKTGISLIETHISWVILTDEFAFKIKKPVHFDFLDFSTLALRRYFCEEELRLNRRLAPQIYLQVLPIGLGGIGSNLAPIIDYALQMRRMDNAREMDKLLLLNEVRIVDVEHLAALLAEFHLQHRLKTKKSYKPEEDAQDFAGLYALESDLAALQVQDVALLRSWEKTIPNFLYKHAPRSKARLHNGFWIEGHGDLHTRNIFLPKDEPPIVFDCLEFSPHFRQIDVLNELAFLCMDLEYFGRQDLSEAFLSNYTRYWNCFEVPEDQLLFIYFKAYRVNVRLKVTLLQIRQSQSDELSKSARAYWLMLKQYLMLLAI